MRSRTNTIVGRLLAVLFVAATVGPAATVAAQGTSGTFPGPINSQQLERYADVLHLSHAQRGAVETAHDDYRRRFRRLRDGEMATFLDEQRAMQGGIPQRAAVEEILEKLERLQTKIAILDNGFFDQILPVLSDRQRSMIPRLRLARERARYEPLQTVNSYGRRSADLSVLFLDLDLKPDALAAADAIVSPYERRLTTIMRKQNEALTRMQNDMMAILAERGYEDISQEALLQDPQLLQEIVGQIQEVYGALREKANELNVSVRELNKRTYRQIAAVIPAAEARKLRNGFYRQSYAEIRGIVAVDQQDWITRALEIEALSAEQRDVLAVQSAELQRKLDRLMNEAIGLSEDFWDNFSPFEQDPDVAQEFRDDLIALGTRASKAQQDADAAILELLGDEVVKTLREEVAALGARAGARTAAGDDESAGEEESPERRYAFSGDRFLPDRISRRDIRRYTTQLQLRGDMSAVLTTLHIDYLQRLSELAVLDELREARAAADAGAEGEGDVGARIDRVYALRRQALAEMAAVDAAFFADLRAIVPEEARPLLDRVERSRERSSYTGSMSARFALGRNNSNEASVDIVSILLEQQPPADVLRAVGDVLATYEGEAGPAFRERLEAQLDMQQMSDKWMIEIQEAAREDLTAVVELQNRYREAMQAPRDHVSRTDQHVIALNRRGLEELRPMMSPALATALDKAYERAAFPSVYNDPASVHRQLATALKLASLSGSQREQLVEIGGTYRNEYKELSRAMTDQLPTSAINVAGLAPAAFKEWQGKQQQLAKIRYDRNELNGRAISRLRAILSEAQVLEIGGLPEPMGEEDFFFLR
jgi:hypothetical protein